MKPDDPLERIEDDNASPSAEVGSEGGSPGDVEVREDEHPAIGSESGETRQPVDRGVRTIDRTREGRRSP